jgi:hypothetical protein
MGAETVDRAATGSGKAAHMARAPDNPDRNFSSNGDPEKTDQDKRPADRTRSVRCSTPRPGGASAR